MERGGSRTRCVTRRFFTRWPVRRDKEDGASIDESSGGRQGVTGVARGLRAPFGPPRKVVRRSRSAMCCRFAPEGSLQSNLLRVVRAENSVLSPSWPEKIESH